MGQTSGCSSVRLERLVWGQEVDGSSPSTPTTFSYWAALVTLVPKPCSHSADESACLAIAS